MSNGKKSGGKPEQIVRKPFLTGRPTDENTVKNSLIFFGTLFIAFFMSFIVCATIAGSAAILRLLVNIAVIAMIAIVYFNRGSVQGAEAVARGEILYQKQEKGRPVAESEKAMCFHKLKAFLIGLLGTLPFFLVALVFAFSTQVQTTSAGTLPSWMQAYARRDDVYAPLVTYTQATAMSLTDILRIVIRVCIMPFISLAGSENHQAVYLVEKLSPLLMLVPACAFGTGYLFGPGARAKVHTAISESNRKRARREKKERRRRAGLGTRSREPEQLN